MIHSFIQEVLSNSWGHSGRGGSCPCVPSSIFQWGGRTLARNPDGGGGITSGSPKVQERENWGRWGRGSGIVTLRPRVSAAPGGLRPQPLSHLGGSPRPPESPMGTGEGHRCPRVTTAWPRAERLAIWMVTPFLACGKPEGSEHGRAGTPGNAPESGVLPASNITPSCRAW